MMFCTHVSPRLKRRVTTHSKSELLDTYLTFGTKPWDPRYKFRNAAARMSPWDKAMHLPGALRLAIPAFRTWVIYATVILSLHGGRSVLTFHFTSALSSKIITRRPQRAFPSWNCPVDYAGDGSVGFPNGGLPLTSTTVLGRFPERGLPHPHVNWLAER